MHSYIYSAVLAVTALATVSACSPTVKIQTPEEPITINLNVNISHEIRVKVDKDLESTFDENDAIF